MQNYSLTHHIITVKLNVAKIMMQKNKYYLKKCSRHKENVSEKKETKRLCYTYCSPFIYVHISLFYKYMPKIYAN